MPEIKQYSDEELEFAENKLKVLSHLVEDDEAKAIKIARWCIERERYDNMDEHWNDVEYISINQCPVCGRKFTDNMVCATCGTNNASIRL